MSCLLLVAAGARQVQRTVGSQNETAALPLREGGGDNAWNDTAQLLRRPSAARFHCDTLSAIMRVDFIAAWLSWA